MKIFLDMGINYMYLRIFATIVVFAGNIKRLLVWIRDNLLKERPELFMQGESV